MPAFYRQAANGAKAVHATEQDKTKPEVSVKGSEAVFQIVENGIRAVQPLAALFIVNT
jgi:hypothetical protein